MGNGWQSILQTQIGARLAGDRLAASSLLMPPQGSCLPRVLEGSPKRAGVALKSPVLYVLFAKVPDPDDRFLLLLTSCSEERALESGNSQGLDKMNLPLRVLHRRKGAPPPGI